MIHAITADFSIPQEHLNELKYLFMSIPTMLKLFIQCIQKLGSIHIELPRNLKLKSIFMKLQPNLPSSLYFKVHIIHLVFNVFWFVFPVIKIIVFFFFFILLLSDQMDSMYKSYNVNRILIICDLDLNCYFHRLSFMPLFLMV